MAASVAGEDAHWLPFQPCDVGSTTTPRGHRRAHHTVICLRGPRFPARPCLQASQSYPRGQIVRVRSRQYRVEELVPPPEVRYDTLVGLSDLDDDAQGEGSDPDDER